jgi:hypothetical protein
LLGLTRTIPWVFLLVALLGATAALSDVFSQSLIQLAVPAGLRGRAGGLWVFAVGSAPIGQMQAGLLAALLGVPIALFLNGGALLVVVVSWVSRCRPQQLPVGSARSGLRGMRYVCDAPM